MKNRNIEGIRTGLISQDQHVLSMLVPVLTEATRKQMKQIIDNAGCKCERDEVIHSFVMEQLVILRTQLIEEPASIQYLDELTVSAMLNSNLKLYTTLTTNEDQNLAVTMMQDTATALTADFGMLLEDRKDMQTILNDFISGQFVKFRVGLKMKPLDYLDISETRFSRFAKMNMIECKEIDKTIRKKVKEFLLKYFHQKDWYRDQPDKLNKIMEDLTQDLVIEFYGKIIREKSTNPYGLLNIICQRRIIDDFNRNKAVSDPVNELNADGEKRASMPAEAKLANDGSMDMQSNRSIVSEIDLKMLRDKLEKDCPKIDHVTLLRLHLEGYSYEEISETTGYLPTSAKTIVHNIKVKIRKGVNMADLMAD